MSIAPEIANALKYYDRRIQISRLQTRIIAGVIAERSFSARLLVHGCGYDSAFWQALNARGRTLFVEHDAQWAMSVASQLPQAEIADYGDLRTTVASTEGSVDIEFLDGVARPAWVDEPWDVILVDGPKGFQPDHPGRALPIFWAASVRQQPADIFVDDYHRPLERLYVDTLLKREGRETVILPHPQGSTMLWRLS